MNRSPRSGYSRGPIIHRAGSVLRLAAHHRAAVHYAHKGQVYLARGECIRNLIVREELLRWNCHKSDLNFFPERIEPIALNGISNAGKVESQIHRLVRHIDEVDLAVVLQ